MSGNGSPVRRRRASSRWKLRHAASQSRGPDSRAFIRRMISGPASSEPGCRQKSVSRQEASPSAPAGKRPGGRGAQVFRRCIHPSASRDSHPRDFASRIKVLHAETEAQRGRSAAKRLSGRGLRRRAGFRLTGRVSNSVRSSSRSGLFQEEISVHLRISRFSIRKDQLPFTEKAFSISSRTTFILASVSVSMIPFPSTSSTVTSTPKSRKLSLISTMRTP